jgi:hypothetical protein
MTQDTECDLSNRIPQSSDALTGSTEDAFEHPVLPAQWRRVDEPRG